MHRLIVAHKQMAAAVEAHEPRAGYATGRVMRRGVGAKAIVARADHQGRRANRLQRIGSETLAQAGVVTQVKKCAANWCRVTGNGFDGWIQQERLWGVYPNEKVD